MSAQPKKSGDEVFGSLLRRTIDMLKRRGIDTERWTKDKPIPDLLLRLVDGRRRDMDPQTICERELQSYSSRSETDASFIELVPRLPDYVESALDWFRAGDSAIEEGDEERALRMYAEAAAAAPAPLIQIEIGGLLLHRQTDDLSPPMMEADFRGFCGTEGPDGLLLRRWLDVELDLEAEFEDKRRLQSMALECFGQACAYYANLAIEWDENFDELDQWRMYPTLDGLRVILNRTPGAEEDLELILEVYFNWQTRVGWAVSEFPQPDTPPPDLFSASFADTRGYLRGRHTAEVIGTASTLTDTPVLLREILKEVRNEPPSRSKVADALKSEFADDWFKLDDFIKEPLIEGDSLLALFKQRDRHDFGAAIAEYAKALEYLCVSIERQPWGTPVLGKFGNLQESPLRVGLRHGAPTDEIVRRVREFSTKRNQWIHASRQHTPARRVPLPEAESLRKLVLGIILDVTKWRKD